MDVNDSPNWYYMGHNIPLSNGKSTLSLRSVIFVLFYQYSIVISASWISPHEDNSIFT